MTEQEVAKALLLNKDCTTCNKSFHCPGSTTCERWAPKGTISMADVKRIL